MNNSPPRWSPRIARSKIARLYEQDSQGFQDRNLADEVLEGLAARAEDILDATSAGEGRIKCPSCRDTVFRKAGKESILRCSQCDWECSWAIYHQSYKGHNLHGRGIKPLVTQFLSRSQIVSSYPEKMRLIDELIHSFHTDISGKKGRAAGINFIACKASELKAFLDQLAGISDDTTL